MKSYLAISNAENSKKQINAVKDLIDKFNFIGTEIAISSLIPREQKLFSNSNERHVLLEILRKYKTSRIHMSYWAEYTDFLTRIDYPSLVARFGNERNVLSYFQDLTGEHVYQRWIQEYEIANALNAEAVVFHCIEYFHIDGLWQFNHSKKNILNALVTVIQKLLDSINKIYQKKGPFIELENAGFGLESGVQTAEDYIYILEKLNDPFNKLRIGWDTNHLLHTTSLNKLSTKEVVFSWINKNITNIKLIDKVNSISISDRDITVKEFFRNGQLLSPHLEKLHDKESDEEKEIYGASLVKKYYDSHLPLGASIHNFKKIINRFKSISIVHELKGHEFDGKSLDIQIANLE